MTRRALGRTRLLVPGRDMPWKVFFSRLFKELDHDAVDDVAATVTFYCVLSLFPFLLFVVGVLSKIVSWETIDDVVHQISLVMPREVTAIVSTRLTALKTQPATGVLTLGFIGALWSASAGVASLIPALNHAYDVVETRPFWRRRLLALATTLGVGLVALVASLVALAVPALAHWVGGTLGEVLSWVRFPIAGAIMMATWALLYQVLPNVKPHFQLVSPGSIVGVILWVIASWGFSQYAQHFGSYEATYGALGGVVVLLLWMWVSALALIMGAEINKILMPVEEKEQIDTHVTNMPETAKRQEGAPEIARETHPGQDAETERAQGEKPPGGSKVGPDLDWVSARRRGSSPT